MSRSSFWKNYSYSILLLSAMLVGSAIGLVFGKSAECLKPFGQVFLNLLFVLVVPVVFFSLSSAIASMSNPSRLGRILMWMILIFVATAVISSSLMVAGVLAVPPAQGLSIKMTEAPKAESVSIADQIVNTLTVGEFFELLRRKNMLAVIVFSILVGLAACLSGEKARPFRAFLVSANEVMFKALSLVMLYAPIGLAAWFAYLIGVFGPELLGSYARAVALYYPLAFLYFFVFFTMYAWISAGRPGVVRFWPAVIPPALTSLATGSSLATVPVSLQAAKRIGVPADIRELVIPIGATIHMDGSCLAAILKIAVLFGLFGRPFEGAATIFGAIGVAILSGVVISGIPSGGMLGELLIVTLYGFPPEALPVISMIGTLVDPPATMVNATGDTVAGMLISRILGGKRWLAQPPTVEAV
ncbi:MAG: dicarboxylate/amino acid:cation symporter [Phycisphaerae bacterium]|nr:dicarboxylate/amino acid:cation symporter [Phycisphaerae bacterium]